MRNLTLTVRGMTGKRLTLMIGRSDSSSRRLLKCFPDRVGELARTVRRREAHAKTHQVDWLSLDLKHYLV